MRRAVFGACATFAALVIGAVCLAPVGCSLIPGADDDTSSNTSNATGGPGSTTTGGKVGDGKGGSGPGSAPDQGKGCQSGAECSSGVCTDGACADPACTDGVKNEDESDVDCGGTICGQCTAGQACVAATDCDSGVCTGGQCQAPSGTDGVKNGDESDVDCGGTTTGAPKCDPGKSCAAHADCASDGCDDTSHCAIARSCTLTNGGATCGQGEVGEAGAKHDSCCTKLPIPGQGTKLDKYLVTAGRMRSFITRVNGNVAGWYASNKNGLSSAARNQIDPFTQYLPTDLESSPYGAKYELGGTIYLTDRPSDLQGCFVGNAGNPAYGSHTYDDGTFEGEDRGFDQSFLDRLPLNCVPYPLMAAFCAWDGGRLQTYAENDAAFGGTPYPWGASPVPGGYRDVNGAWTVVGPATQGFTSTPCPGCDPNLLNWSNAYQNPPGGNENKYWDYAYWMSPPGRFPMDKGPGGHMDIAADLIELTATPGSNDAKYGATVRWSRAGSWESHGVNTTSYQFAVMTKYGKTGGRCAYDN